MANRLHPVHKRTRADIQICQDCDGVGSIPDPERAPRFMQCDTCTGQGMFVHRAPYRLANGDWSDGVDRSKRIADQHRGDECISRMYVWQFHSAYYDKSMWAVARSEPYTDQDFHKFAEAIAYADKYARLARTNQGENNV